MGRRSESTPRGKVKEALRRLSLRSRERNAALRRDHYTCQICGTKKSVAKGREVQVEVHHIKGVQWEVLIDIVYEMLLCHPADLVTMCKSCHNKEMVQP